MRNKVTIAIPTLNRAEYLRTALDSALAQSYSNIEVVVSNNACTDNTASVLESLGDSRLHVLEQKNTLGMMENWNACLRAASGKYFLLLSDDDVLEPTAIEEMVDAFEESERQGPSLGFVYCNGKVIDQNGKTLALAKEAPVIESAQEMICAFFDGKRTPWACSILFRTEELASGYDVRFSLMADAAQWIRIAAAHGTVRFVDRQLTRYRMHQNATLQTCIARWHRENVMVSEFAIEELQKAGQVSDEVTQEIRKSVHRLNASITSDLINRSLGSDKLKALREYWAYLGIFTSSSGIPVLMRGLALLMLPDFFRVWLRSRLRPQV